MNIIITIIIIMIITIMIIMNITIMIIMNISNIFGQSEQILGDIDAWKGVTPMATKVKTDIFPTLYFKFHLQFQWLDF